MAIKKKTIKELEAEWDSNPKWKTNKTTKELEAEWDNGSQQRNAEFAGKDYNIITGNLPNYSKSFYDSQYKMGGSADIKNSAVIPKFETYGKYAPIISNNLAAGVDYLGMTDEELAEYQKALLDAEKEAMRDYNLATARTGGYDFIDTTGMKKRQVNELERNDNLYRYDETYEKLQQFPDQDDFEANRGWIFNGMSEKEYLDWYMAHLREQKREEMAGAEAKRFEDQANELAASVQGDGKYVQGKDYWRTLDRGLLNSGLNEFNIDGEVLSYDEYLQKAEKSYINDYMGAVLNDDEDAIIELMDVGSAFPELQRRFSVDALAYADKDQAKTAINFINNDDMEGLYNFLGKIDYDISKDMVTEWNENATEWANESVGNQILGTIASFPLNLVGGVYGAADTVSGLLENFDWYKNMVGEDVHSQANAGRVLLGMADIPRNELGQTIADATPFLNYGEGKNLANTAFQGITSLGDSILSMAGGPFLQAVSMFGQEAGAELYEQQDKGNDKAAIQAAGVGLASALMEKIGIDSLIKGSLKKAILGNAGEEGLTEVAHIILDKIINGKNSDYDRLVDQYRTYGYGDKAEFKAGLDKTLDVIESTLGGLFAGFVGGAPDAISARNEGKRIRTNEGMEALANLADTLPVSKDVKAIVARMKAEVAESKKGAKGETAIDDTAAVTKEDADAMVREAEMTERDRNERAEETKDALEDALEREAEMDNQYYRQKEILGDEWKPYRPRRLEDGRLEGWIGPTEKNESDWGMFESFEDESDLDSFDDEWNQDSFDDESDLDSFDDESDLDSFDDEWNQDSFDDESDLDSFDDEWNQDSFDDESDLDSFDDEWDQDFFDEWIKDSDESTDERLDDSGDFFYDPDTDEYMPIPDHTHAEDEQEGRFYRLSYAERKANDDLFDDILREIDGKKPRQLTIQELYSIWINEELGESWRNDSIDKYKPENATVDAGAITERYKEAVKNRENAAAKKENAGADAKKADMAKRDRAEKAGKKKPVTNAEIGYVFREVMSNIDKGAQKVVARTFEPEIEAQLQESGLTGDIKGAAQTVIKWLSGDNSHSVLNAIKNNEKIREVALSFMGQVTDNENALRNKAADVARRASRNYVDPNATKAQKGAEEATEGIDDRAEVTDEDVELVMSGMPESTVDGKEVSIEDVKVGEDGGITYTVKDAEGNVSEVSEGDIQIGENDADTARLTESAKELGRNADVMLKAYNAEQNTDIVEYGRQFKQAVQYGEDGRNLDTMKGSRTFTELTDTQVELAYEVGRGMRMNRNNAMVRKNVSGIKVGQVDTSRVNMGSLTKHQRTAVHTMGRLAKAAGFNIKFIESKVNAEGKYTTENGNWDPETLTLTLDVHAGSNTVSDVNYAMMHTAGHELTHYIRQFADTDLWNSYQEFVVGHLSKKEGEGFSIDDQINEHMEIARSEGRKLTRDKAIEEIVANASGEALNSITEADIQALAETNPSLLNKVKQFFERWIKSVKAAIKAAYSGTEAKTAEAKQMMDAVDEMGKRWNELFVNATKNRAAETNAVNDTVKDTVSENDSPMNEAVDFVDYAWPGEVKYSPRRTKQEIANIQAIGEKSVNDFDSDDIKKTSTLAQQYFKEMGTKSPFFKAWFGDWRANDTSPVLIANTIGKERGEVSNADTGWNIQVSGKVFNETKSHNGVVNTEALPYLDYINDIVKKAVLLDTFGMRVPKSENSVLMHNMYAIADIGNGAELLKLYVEEMNDVNRDGTAKRAYQLQNIEKQPLTVKGSGKSLASAQSTAAIKSVADLHRIVKAHGELEGAKSVDAKMTNADGTPKVMYHGTPYGGFTVFKDWQYFTDNSEYANVYQEPSASSIRGRYNPATNPKTYEVYLNVKKPFDTRDPKIRKIWQEEFYNQYSRTPLSEKGLPDWTDGIDLVEFIEDNDYDFDAIILDEGATGGYGDDVQSRGISVVVRSSNQVKSATDNIGTFDPNNPDINYQSRDLSNLSDRELLVRSLETELTPAERDHLERYKTKVDALAEKQRRLDEISGKIVEMKKAGATAKTSEELRKLETNATTLRASINRADEALNKIESAAMIKEVIRRNRAEVKKAATEAAKARADERVKRAVEKERAYSEKVTRKIRENAEKRIEAAKKSGDTKYRNLREWQEKEKYRKQVEQDTKRLYKWLTAPGKQGSVPEFLRKPVGDFIEQLDFSSVTKLKGGADTNRDIDFRNALDNLRAAISNLQSQQTDIDGGAESFYGYIDLPMHFAQRFDENVQAIKKALDVGGNRAATPIERMTAAQMKELSQAMRILSSSITKINKFLSEGRGTTPKNLADVTIDEAMELKARKKTNKALELLNSTFNWKNATPINVFQRLGLGGKAIFERLQNGWDKMAFNMAQVIEYAKATFTEEERRKWSGEITKVKLDNGEEFQMTTAQKMSLYCLQKRPQAQGHLMGGGIRISDIDGKRGTKITQADDYTLTMDDITRITHSLTDRQREVADKLQHFMNTTCPDWGNEISMKRFGFRQMEETNYFPIETDANNRARIDETKDGKTSMFRLLNMSALKPLTPNANNAIVIKDIFNVFSDHASDMAKYNALALPILDFIKWYNHVERSDVRGDDGKANGQIKTRSVQKALEHAFGQDAKSYLTAFIRDLNAEHDGGRNDGLINSIVGRAKSAAVGANLRVYGLQITSLPRAAYAINPAYLIKGMAKLSSLNPVNAIRGTEAQEKVGILKWKKLGFYSTDISRSTRGMVKQDEGILGKLRNWSMAPAGWGDNWVSNIIYEAVKAEMKDKHSDIRPGSADYNRLVNERVREIVYRTQVVDSTMTRSDFMRSKGLASTLTAFMSEPTLTVNMLNESIQKAVEAKRKGGSTRDVLRASGGLAVRAATTFAVTAVITSLVESMFDALRDDDEYETFREKFMGALFGTEDSGGNLADNFNIFGMLPYIKDVISIFQGYENSSLITQGWQQVQDFRTSIESWQAGKAPIYRVVYNGAKAASSMGGVGVGNAMRDFVSMYNTFLAPAWDMPKLQTYEDNETAAATAYHNALTEGRTEDAEYYMQRMEAAGMDMEKVNKKLTSLSADRYTTGEMTEAEMRRQLAESGYTEKKIEDKMRDLNFKKETGVAYTEFKSAYTTGIINKSEATRLLKKYRGYDDNEVYFTLEEWDGGEEWSKYGDFLDAVDRQSGYAAEAKKLLDHGVDKKYIAGAISEAYKDAYREVHGTYEGNRLLEYLLDVYEAIGYDREYERKYITKNWIKD